MKLRFVSMLFTASLFAVAASAQEHSNDIFVVKELDLAAGYTAVRANAPPQGGCSCFWMNGGNAEIAVANRQRFGLVANFGMTTANNIGADSGHDLTLATFLAGPRFSLKERHRLSSFAQILLGAAHSSTNNTLDNEKTSFALATGGGVDLRLIHRISWRVLQAEYLYTQIPNGLNNEQNQLRLTSSIVFHLR